MEGPLKRKVTSKLTYNATRDPSPPYRPPSPLKSYVSSTPSTNVVRPKAKVNSSATPASARSKVSKPSSTLGTPSARSAATGIPRPASPLKSSSSAGAPKMIRAVRSNLHPQSSQSTPGTPTVESHRLGSPEFQTRPRFGSVSSRPGSSSSSALGLTNGSLGLDSIFTPPSEIISDVDAVPKVKSKISRVAKHASDTLSPSPGSESGRARIRADSIASSPSFSSNITSSPKLDFPLYPITTATPAANPHRYAPNRPPSHHAYQTFSSSPPNDVTVNYSRIMTKIDPASVPLPPHSPPTSAVSLSSRSSVSRSSVSFTDSASTSTSGSVHYVNGLTSNSNAGRLDLRGTIDALVQFNGMSTTDDSFSEHRTDEEEEGEEEEERKVKDEAKSNRKIADLEITNKSLLAINSSLEATKHRQAKEIRELRRKLRESRLILPPRTFRAITSKDEEINDIDDDPEDDEDDEVFTKEDETYMRIRMRMDELIETGKRALMTKPADFAESKGGAKVLSEEEVRDWRDSGRGRDADGKTSLLDPDENEEKLPSSRSLSRNDRRKGHDAEDIDEITSEDEVEAMTLPRHSVSPSPSASPPPIVVTHSH